MDSIVRQFGEPLAIHQRTSFPSFCEDETCTTYIFVGLPARWVISYREYWVVANAKHRVVRTIIIHEP